VSMFDGPCMHGRASEFDCDDCSYDPSKVKPDPQKCGPINAGRILAELAEEQAKSGRLAWELREAKARVTVLTAALTGIVAYWDRGDSGASARARRWQELIDDRARAALAAVLKDEL
jgi:hypothetical protein